MWRFNNYIYIENILKEKQFKLTAQRRTVLQIFIENTERNLSAEDVHVILQRRATGIGLATVYRTLELLEGLSILERHSGDDGRNRYEIRQEEKGADVSQFICVSCGRVIEFAGEMLTGTQSEAAKKVNFHVLHKETKVYGYCSECK